MISITTVWNFKNRKTKDGKGPVDIRLIINRKSYYINTGVRVRKDNFSCGMIVGIDEESRNLNKILISIVSRVQEEVAACIAAKRPVNVKEIKEKIFLADSKEEVPELLDWMEDECKCLDLRSGTIEHYKLLIRRLKEFGKITQWKDVNIDKIYKWNYWLKDLRCQSVNTRTAKHVSANTIHNYHKHLKAMISRAVKKGMLTSNPYDALRGEFKCQENDRINYLTEEQMKKFVEMEISGGILEVAHDLFVFQMYTGLSYADAQAFDISNYRQIDGKWQYVGNRIKTGVQYVNQLLEPAIHVLEKYDMATPKISNQKYNVALKLLGEKLKLSTSLHSHAARHTFATWMLRNGVRIENVGKMLGQKSIRTTQRYAKVLSDDVYNDFDRIAEKMSSKH